ncbi:hypothetical protein ZWY2020_028227 [Hordeum vulgare]|nr:hypothetical protein ZWY2020_028227 [Hordeum vulgare]
MAFRRAVVSLVVHSHASYCLHHAAASPPTLKPPPPPPPTLSCPVTVPCCSFAAPPHHICILPPSPLSSIALDSLPLTPFLISMLGRSRRCSRTMKMTPAPDSTTTSRPYSLGSSPMKVL